MFAKLIHEVDPQWSMLSHMWSVCPIVRPSPLFKISQNKTNFNCDWRSLLAGLWVWPRGSLMTHTSCSFKCWIIISIFPKYMQPLVCFVTFVFWNYWSNVRINSLNIMGYSNHLNHQRVTILTTWWSCNAKSLVEFLKITANIGNSL